jgi:hypothetical protein
MNQMAAPTTLAAWINCRTNGIAAATAVINMLLLGP